MDLKMEVYTPALELIGFLETHRSAIWSEKAFTAGKFSIESLITKESIEMLQPDNIIWIEGETAGIIETIMEESGPNGPYITASGPTLTGILDRRVLWKLYSLKGTAPEIMHMLVNDCCVNPTRGDVEARKVHGLVLMDAPAGGDAIQIQKTGGTLLEALEQLGETYGVAFGVRFNPAVPQMEFWTRCGQNRSINQDANDPVLYSTELDDVLASEYLYNSQDYRNVALVAGEGEGSDRIYVTVEEDSDIPTPPTPPVPGETYTVTLLVDPAGVGTASGGKTVAAGTSITVTASPSDGYTFTEWRENGVMVSKSASYTFTVNSDRTLTAVFFAVVKQYTITATVDPSRSGNVTGAGTYDEGATANLKATANDGFKFSEWKENGASVHSEPEYFFTVNANRNLTAEFSKNKPSRLPTGYTEVEYIQSSGTQYIDTGRKPTSTIKLSIDLEILETATSTAKMVFGSWYIPSGTSTTKYYLMVRWDTGGVAITTGSISGSGANPTYRAINSNTNPRRMVVSVDYPNKSAAIDNESTISLTNVSTSTAMITLKLLASALGAACLNAKLYSCKMEDSSATSEWVPCIDPNDKVGLYDLIGSKFYGNAGTGEFTAGPAV